MKNAVRAAFAATFAIAFVSFVFAQVPTRVRGTIEKVDGSTLVVKARDGAELRVKPKPDAKVYGITKSSLDQIKPGSYVGSAAVPTPDGNLKALEVHVFPENMRGTGEGHSSFDMGPKSTMTNATVVDAEVGKDGKTLSVKYKGGEKKIVVPPTAPVVTYVPANRDDLKPGAKIVVPNATKLPDGTFETASINVGMNGLTPPM